MTSEPAGCRDLFHLTTPLVPRRSGAVARGPALDAPTPTPSPAAAAPREAAAPGGLDTASLTVGLADGNDQPVPALTGTDDQDLSWSPDSSLLAVAGAVVTPMCGDADAAGPPAPAGGCDVARATPGVRVVSGCGGQLRQVSDTTSLLQAGLAFAA